MALTYILLPLSSYMPSSTRPSSPADIYCFSTISTKLPNPLPPSIPTPPVYANGQHPQVHLFIAFTSRGYGDTIKFHQSKVSVQLLNAGSYQRICRCSVHIFNLHASALVRPLILNALMHARETFVIVLIMILQQPQCLSLILPFPEPVTAHMSRSPSDKRSQLHKVISGMPGYPIPPVFFAQCHIAPAVMPSPLTSPTSVSLTITTTQPYPMAHPGSQCLIPSSSPLPTAAPLHHTIIFPLQL
ncbi:hypothetical protein BDQ17DRAFT_1438432 [Cyathus striatus]|nr:hypothetical protein BDQ17DRAFT_1438432 [Cyathus striatus]